MTQETRLYSVKKPTHWLWRTNVTRDQVLQRLEATKIAADWMICPLGEAAKAITVERFAANPDIFEAQKRPQRATPEPVIARREPSSNQLPKQPTRVPSIPRRHDLDALRAIAMLLGIVLHGALAYIPMPAAGWPVQDVHQNESYGLLLSAIHGFRLPLFFVVSGFFTAMLWRKRGLAALLKHRFHRIFVPLVIGTLTIVPAVWVVSIGAGIAGAVAAKENARANLWTAATENNLDEIKQLLADGAAVNQMQPASGATPMSIASWHGNVEAIELLIAAGADVNARSRDGATPLHGAALFGKAKTAQRLIDHGASLNARNRIGETAAETLGADWTRTVVAAALNQFEVDRGNVYAGREEVARVLRDANASSTSTTEQTTASDENTSKIGIDPGEPGLSDLLLLLTLFPFFHHLWFLWFLCWLVAAFGVYAKLVDVFPWKPPAWLVISPLRYAWLIPLTILPQAMMGLIYPNFGPDTSAGLLPILKVLVYYAVFFFFGAIYFDCDDSAGRLGRWWRVTLPLALLVVFPLGCELSLGGFGFLGDEWMDSAWYRPLAVVLQVLYTWLMTFGLMGMFRSLLSHQSKTMRYISDSSYWLYLAHLPLIIVAQAVVRDWPLPPLVKLTLICAVTSALLLASYQLLVRYTWIGTMLNGPRTRPQPAQPEHV